MKRALRYIMIPAAAALMALPAVAAPASADAVRLWLFVNGVAYGYGEVGPEHHVIYACDTRRDGYGIRVVVGNGQSVRDRNGSDPGCGERHFDRTINEFKVCYTDNLVILGCTGFVDA